MNCSGKRDVTEKVQKKNMGDRMLLSGETVISLLRTSVQPQGFRVNKK